MANKSPSTLQELVKRYADFLRSDAVRAYFNADSLDQLAGQDDPFDLLNIDKDSVLLQLMRALAPIKEEVVRLASDGGEDVIAPFKAEAQKVAEEKRKNENQSTEARRVTQLPPQPKTIPGPDVAAVGWIPYYPSLAALPPGHHYPTAGLVGFMTRLLFNSGNPEPSAQFATYAGFQHWIYDLNPAGTNRLSGNSRLL